MARLPELSATGFPAQYQPTFDELGTPLREVTFVVVDLETTGGSPAACAITEIGAVKVRGGEVLGTFQTLVNPDQLIPPFIAVLTGITQRMVAEAPRIDAALAAFLDFARDTVLVAHNAPFDLGFLKAACTTTGRSWPDFDSVDTAKLARRVLTRDEAPNCKLSTLARLFRTRVTPSHRALADAEATVDVLHGLLDRLGNQGVQSLDELRTYSSQVTVAQRRKRHLAEALPHAPGVYLFRDERGTVLYVGKSKDLRTRVRNYFVASENRTRMSEMVGLAERVDHIACATGLEAEVRELRLIAEHKPRYNRRSRFPERAVWLKVTDEPFPRLSTVREVRDDGATYLGPFGSRGAAERALTALHDSFPVRQCTARLSPRKPTTACVLAEMGRCGAPCDGTESLEDYAVHVEAVRVAITVSPREVVAGFERRMAALADHERYEDAAMHRDRLAAFVRASARMQRLSMLAGCREIVAAQPSADKGWLIHVVRHGRLVAAGVVPRGAAPRPYVDALIATAETVRPGPGPTPCATAEEMECVLRWLDLPGTRLVELDGTWASPAYGAGGAVALLAAAPAGRDAADPFADRRGLRPVHQPNRSPLRAPVSA
ncbi:MAG: polymerase subunit epsilon [Frankiales bacterium]|nr:polymerase subunit epsilon [Frankiales bacterium]